MAARALLDRFKQKRKEVFEDVDEGLPIELQGEHVGCGDAPSPSASRETIPPNPTAAPGPISPQDLSAPRHLNVAAHQGIGGGSVLPLPA